MSTIIGIMGQSGGGKTTAMRTLDPSETFYIDADKKGLSWQGWNKQYNIANNNYAKESGVTDVWKLIQSISDNRPEIRIVVVDTVNAIMLDDEMSRMKEKGFDKWVELSQCVYSMISDSNTLRDDLIVIFIFWEQDRSEGDDHFYHFLTSGKKLEKIVLENKFPMVLRAVCKDGNFVFETQANSSTAKSPMGLFDTPDIDNDMYFVIKSLRKYMADDPLPTGDFELQLIEQMSKDNIANYQLLKYAAEKGFLPEGADSITDIRPDVMQQILLPENWAKVKAAIGRQENPSIDETKLSEPAKIVRGLMQIDHINAVELRLYLLEKQFITPLQKWYETAPDILTQMAKPGTWDIVVNKIISKRGE